MNSLGLNIESYIYIKKILKIIVNNCVFFKRKKEDKLESNCFKKFIREYGYKEI